MSISLLWSFTINFTCFSDETRSKGKTEYQMVTGDDSEEDRSQWDKKYKTKTYIFGKEPALFLKEHVHLLPVGKALDIAMGEGRNAIYLAKKGFIVEGVDISEVALQKAKMLARDNNVTSKLLVINADLNTYTIKSDYYEVIIDFYYLQRSLFPQIKKGLKKGGIVVFETYTEEQLKNKEGQRIPKDYLLKIGELREAFKDFEILVYRETNNGKEAIASLVARKR
ncbi:MAG: methyltransferase domain-containing protein [Deltaproteobacteria bacterium]|nr:methyltransferase domain-containing protein [Deltaproteobacteria bacterium]